MEYEAKRPRRALILAGGGIKVAFQAGVLQVWLDEAELEFDLADGASGGCLNLAMWCQGMSGRKIADNWRNLEPKIGVDFNWAQYLRLFYAASLFELGAYRQNVFPQWGLDWGAIRRSGREATFNVYNFTRHELAVLTPDQMSEDFLIASISLPMWFPPVRIGGEVFIDAAFNTDANLEEAIRRGADELWIIWTVGQSGEWRDGFVAQYFQIIEAAANGRYNQVLARIEENNRRIEAGDTGEFGRPIVVRELKAEVPLHYLINFSQDRLAEAVNRGVEAGRAWCREHGISLRQEGPSYPTDIHTVHTVLSFTEQMKGYVALGETDHQRGQEVARKRGEFLRVRLTIRIDGVNRFITHPNHEAAIEGTVEYQPLGGTLTIDHGRFNLFVDHGDPSQKRMLYRIHFRDPAGEAYTLSGLKEVRDDPGFDIWSDTSTLYTRIYRGTITEDQEDTAEIAGAGIIRITLPDFMKQLTTFRVEAPTVADRTAALARFGQMFLGKLWDVYARDVLSSGPI